MPRYHLSSLPLALSFALMGCGSQASEPELPAFNLDPERTSVVGLSSGAAMAQQVHFAYSNRLLGAGLIAGPPFGCAQGDLKTALGPCMKAQPQAPDVNALAEQARTLAREGKIAALTGMQGDRVYVLHGKADDTVQVAVGKAAYSLYQALHDDITAGQGAPMQLHWEGEREMGHAWPTLEHGGECAATEAPFIAACGFDAAGDMLAALYGPPARAADQATGSLQRFKQNPFRPDGQDAYLAEEGFLYAPPQCTQGSRCGTVIAFHGCEQNIAALDDRFAREVGLNRWADVHDLIVIYPQTRSSFVPLNPKGCWDWWGYSGPDYATRDGVQLRWLEKLLQALGMREWNSP